MMRAFDFLERILVVISIIALIIMTTMICISVTGRYLFNMPIPDDLVFSEFLMIFLVFLPLASVQAAREHVFVSIFTEWMPNRHRFILETFGGYVGLFVFAIISVAVFSDFLYAWDWQSYVDGPLELVEWPPKLALFVGIAVFTVRLAIAAAQSAIAIINDTGKATKSEEDRVLASEL